VAPEQPFTLEGGTAATNDELFQDRLKAKSVLGRDIQIAHGADTDPIDRRFE
jgi:hypothetical protein